MGGLFKSKTISNTATKIADFQINSATYGAVVPFPYGTTRRSGNVIDYYDFKQIPHTTTQRSGKGGTKVQNTDWTYEVACLIGLGEGPLPGIGRVWKDDEILNSPAAMGLTFFAGEHGQAPWAYTLSKYPEKALPYSGLAYVAGVIDLGSSGSLPNLNFELRGHLLETGDGIDANPADVINTIIFDAINGIGFGQSGIVQEGLSRLRTFCKAADLLISDPAETDRKKAYEIINDICDLANTFGFWSQSRLKLVPLCDEYLNANGAEYIPDNTPIYDLNEDDYLEDKDGKLITFERTDNSQAYNQTTIEFINRANNYEVESVQGEILTDINRRGLRPADTESIPYLYTKPRAQYVADVKVLKYLYGRNRYIFRLDWSYCLLEPGDKVTLSRSSPNLKLSFLPVIIDEVEEAEDGELEFIAIGKPPGLYSPARYTIHEADRPRIEYNAAPGNVNEPVIFEAPGELSGGDLEAWVAISGQGEYWAGSYVWGSLEGESYKQIGTIGNPNRTGTLLQALPLGESLDTANVLKVSTAESRSELLSVSQEVFEAKKSLLYVGGEFISYKNATLTGAYTYEISNLQRGLFGSTIKEHSAGERFAIISDNLFKYPYTAADIGKTIYLKFASFNIWGTATENLEDVEEYQHILTGDQSGVGTPPDLDYFSVSVLGGDLVFSFRRNGTDGTINGYDIRKGEIFEASQLVARVAGKETDQATVPAVIGAEQKYWIASFNDSGYCAQPLYDTIDIDSLPEREVVISQTDYITPVSTISGDGVATGSVIAQKGGPAYDELLTKTYTEMLSLSMFGPAQNSVTVTGGIIDIGKIGKVIVSVNERWVVSPDQPSIIEIITSTDGENWTDWKLLTAGAINAQYIELRETIRGVKKAGIIRGVDVTINAFSTTLVFRDVVVPVGGLHITYPVPYVNKPANIVSPNGMVRHVKKTNETRYGFDLQLMSADGLTDIGGIADISSGGF